ncbi:hypothetical protein EJB05_39943, partial [Eragrostis curvula]
MVAVLGVGVLALQLLATALAASPIALPGCPESCGGVRVPYPFGIGEGCFHQGFNLTCDGTQHPPKLFMGNGVEVLDISFPDGTVRILSNFLQSPSTGFNGSWSVPAAATGPFKVSSARNSFVAFGCNIFAFFSDASVCAAVCSSDVNSFSSSSCSGVSCCRTSVAAAGDLPVRKINHAECPVMACVLCRMCGVRG